MVVSDSHCLCVIANACVCFRMVVYVFVRWFCCVGLSAGVHVHLVCVCMRMVVHVCVCVC